MKLQKQSKQKLHEPLAYNHYYFKNTICLTRILCFEGQTVGRVLHPPNRLGDLGSTENFPAEAKNEFCAHPRAARKPQVAII